MRKLDDKQAEEIDRIFLDSLRFLDSYVHKYSGADPKMEKRAKAAQVVIGSCVRRLATETNRLGIEAALGRLPPTLEAAVRAPALPAASRSKGGSAA